MMSLQKIFARGKANPEKDKHEDFKKEDYTIKFYRTISEPFINLVEPYEFVTPNRLTWLGYFCFILGAIVLYLSNDNVFMRFLSGFFCFIGIIFDCMDGGLARRRGVSTRRGEWLDTTLEEFKGFPFFLAIGLIISDNLGNFTINVFEATVVINVWFLLFVFSSHLAVLSLGALNASMIFGEPRIVSFSHVFFLWALMIVDVYINGLLEYYLVLHALLTILVVIYTFFEKTFLTQMNE